MTQVAVGSLTIANHLPFVLLAGPCQMESRDHAFMVAGQLKEITENLGIGLVYKSSFDKANRTSLHSQRGIGMEKALSVFEAIKKELHLPVMTDVHAPDHCAEVASVVDVLQIPAFLCRQTDLLVAAAQTKRAINIKKGQFLAPWDMRHVVQKMRDSGNDQVMVCERGASFGYNTLVTDFRSLPIMAETTGQPVVFDATHSVQQPGGMGGASGGERRFVPILARAAVAVGIAAIFMETHENPDAAPSDGPCMVPLADMPNLLADLQALDRLTKARAVAA